MDLQRPITAVFVSVLVLLVNPGCAWAPSKTEKAYYYKKGSTRAQYEELDKTAREFAIRKTQENRSTDLYSLDPDDRVSALLLAESYRDAFFRQEGWKRVSPKYAERRWEKDSRKKADPAR